MTIDTSAGYQEGSTNDPPKQDEPKPEAKPEAPKQEPEKGNPLTALIQERQGRRDETASLRSELSNLRQELASLKAPEQPKTFTNPHNPEEHPMDFLRAEIEGVKADVAQAKQGVGSEQEQLRQQQALLDYERNTMTEISLASAQTPVIMDAHQYVAQNFMNIAKAQGAGSEAGNRARMAMLQGYLNAASQGKDAVLATLEMAQAMGFNPQSAPNGDAKVKQQDQRIERGHQAATQSLGGVTGGDGATQPPDAHALAQMSKDQLTANNRAGLNRIKDILRGNV